MLTAIDVFAGCGGSSIGFRRAGFRIVGAVEKDATAAASYKRNLGFKPVIADICEITGPELLHAAGLSRGGLSVLIGCAPCQGFTSHRRDGTRGRDPRNALLDEFMRLVRSTRPEFVVFENVPGLAKGPSRWRFEHAKRALAVAGYSVAHGLVESADYGTPQFRRRLLVIASRVVAPALPEPTHGEPSRREVRLGQLRPWLTVRSAIGDLSRLRPGRVDSADELHKARTHSDMALRRLRHVPRDGGSRDSLPPELVLACHRNHDGHHDVYGRMWWDKPAPTLTSGCTNVTRGRFAHPDQDRAITIREALLLQGFPRFAWVGGGIEQQSLQVGNAVPPPLAAATARAIRAALSRGAVKAAA